MREEFKFNGPNSWRLHGRLWQSPGSRRSLVGVHGYSEHSGAYSHFAEFLTQHGFDVIWLDLPGHGKSDGRRNNIDDFTDYLESLEGLLLQASRRRLPQPFYLFGHSLGGLVSTRFIQTSPFASEFEGLLLCAPFYGIYNFSGLKNLLVRPLVRLLPNLTLPNESNLGISVLTHDLEMQKKREADPLIKPCVTTHWVREVYRAQAEVFNHMDQIQLPVGIFQGEDELVVDIERVKDFYQKISGPKFFKSYPNFRHEILNEIHRQTVMNDMMAWLESLQNDQASSDGALGST